MASARTVTISVLGNTASLEAAMARAGIVTEEASKKIQGSAAAAGRAASEQAKAMGASATEQEAAAGRAAAAFTQANAKISASQKEAGAAAAKAAAVTGAALDEQRAAYARAVTATGAYEAAQKKAADAATAAATRAKAAGASFASFGGKVATAGLLAFTGAAYEGVKGATNLQAAMERLYTQAGSTQAEVGKLTTGVLNMAGAVGQSPQTLADGMYHVASSLNTVLPAATRTSTELHVLRIAAEGAGVGGANLVDVTNALDAAVVSGISGAQNYSQAMGNLNATVGAGDMSMQNLADALGTGLLAPMKVFGLNLKQVGGALAQFGSDNIRGADAATKLAAAVRIMAAPSKAGAKALATIGISSLKLADDMRSGGLIKALADLRAHLDAAGVHGSKAAALLTEAFGRKQSTGVLILESQLQGLVSRTNDVGAAGGKFAAAWRAYTQTTAYKIAQLKDGVSALADKFGGWLIPKLLSAVHAISDVVDWFAKGSAAAKALGGVIVGVLGTAVAAFAYSKAVAFVGAVRNMGSGIATLARGVTSAAQAIAREMGLISSSSEATATQVGASNTAMEGTNATAGASFTTAATEAGGAGAAVDTEWAAAAAGVGTADAAMEAANTGLIASFAAVAATLSPLLALFAAYKAFTGTGGLNAGIGENGPVPGAPKGLSREDQIYWHYLSPTDKRSVTALISTGMSPSAALSAEVSANATGAGALPGTIASIVGIVKGAGSGGSGAGSGIPSFPGVSGAALPTAGKTTRTASGSLPGWSASQSAVARTLLADFMGAGISKAGAAGLVGNFMQESSLNPSMSSAGGIGLASWTGSRAAELKAFASQLHQSWTSLTVQASFVMKELKGSYGSVLGAIRNSTNASAAADVIGHHYEVAGIMGNRDAYAALVAAHLTGTSTSSKGATLTPTQGPGPNVLAMLKLAEELVGAPYSKAGHAAAFNETVAQIKKFGTDCSGLVSVLLKEGVSGIKQAQTTQGLPTAAGLAPGAGRYVTVYDRHTGAVGNEHTLIEILGKFFESGGNSQFNPSGGVTQLTAAQAAGELAGGGFEKFHPTAAGLAGPVAGAKAATTAQTATSAGVSLQSAINKFIAALDKAASAMIQTYDNLVQSGSLKSLEKALGLHTGGAYRTFTHTVGGGHADMGEHVKKGSGLGALTRTVPDRDREAFKDELLKQLVKVHGYALAQLDHDLGVKHGTALKTLVDKLVGLHGAALTRIEQRLGHAGGSHLAGSAGGHGDMATGHHKGLSGLLGHAGGHGDTRHGFGPLGNISHDLAHGAPARQPETYSTALRRTIEAISPKAIIHAMTTGKGPFPLEGAAGPANPAYRAALVKELAKVHGQALKELEHDLGLKHGAAMDKLVAKLTSLHGKALEKLEHKLVTQRDKSRVPFDPLAPDRLRQLGHELQHEPAKNLPSLMKIVDKAAAQSPQGRAFAAEVKSLIAAGQTAQAKALVAAHTAAMHALAQELYAEQVSKDGELLAFQASVLKDQTTIMQNNAADVLNIAKAAEQATSDAAAAQVTHIQAMTQFITDRFSGIASAIQNAATAMSDASNAVVQGIQDATTIKVDILGERGLYGLNLIAQKEQVQLDVMKAGFDKQEAAAQANLDQVTKQVQQAENQVQLDLDSRTIAQDQLVALAQAHDDQVHITAAVRLAAAQARVDSVTLHEDTAVVGPAQMAVDLGATLPKAQQDVLAGILKKAQGQADKAEGEATKNLTKVTDTQNNLVQLADNRLTNTTDTANRIIAQAQQTVAATTGAGNAAIAAASKYLTGVEDAAQQAEATAQAQIDLTKEESSTQYAGSGLVVNIYGQSMTDSQAIASEVGWALRTAIPA